MRFCAFELEVSLLQPPPQGSARLEAVIGQTAKAVLSVSNPSPSKVDFVVHTEGSETVAVDNTLAIDGSATVRKLCGVPY